MSDRIVYRFTWLALAISVTTGLLIAAADTAGSETGIAFALAFMLLFFFVSVPFLIVAAVQPNVELLDALLDGGADANIRSSLDSGFRGVSLGELTALDTAAFANGPARLAAVRRLLDAGADASTSFIRLGACHHGDLALLDLAGSAGAPEQPDRKGNACLHVAAQGGHVQMLERLLADGADPNVANQAGIRPMDAALARRKYGAALTLAKAGGRATVQRALQADPADADLAALHEWLEAHPRP